MGRAALLVIVVLAAGVAVFALALDATRDRPPALAEHSGEPSADRGGEAIARYGCGDCHTIPGIREATATVGPPLADWRDRAYIAGRMANTPKNLARWIANPQSIEPGTAMPDLEVPPSTARAIAGYLFDLR
jgi:cytochrome c